MISPASTRFGSCGMERSSNFPAKS
jgi:hypothetical protein